MTADVKAGDMIRVNTPEGEKYAMVLRVNKRTLRIQTNQLSVGKRYTVPYSAVVYRLKRHAERVAEKEKQHDFNT